MMKNNNSTLRRNSFSFTTVLIGALLLSGFYLYRENHTRQYSSGIKATEEKEQGALGMMQYFYNARKNMATGKMDYDAMAAANAEADKLQQAINSKTARTMSTPLSMTWNCMGPSNIGGRTRALLVDNQDPTRQTVWACAVSGGIWKSTNGGQLWDSVPGNDQFASLNATCIAEDANGVLYVGTGEGFGLYAGGEGFSTAMIGGGIFKSTDHGNTWNVLTSTKPAPNTTTGWAYVNRIAIDPNNANNIYAATQGGLMYSSDGGTTWSTMHKALAPSQSLGGGALDVKISKDGSLLLAFAGGKVWYAYPSGLVTLMTQLPSTLHDGGVYGGNCTRVEIAISPSNPNYAYLSVIIDNNGGLGKFGSGSTAGTGIYFTMTAKNNGGYWYNIGPGGSNTFNPYSSGGSQDQAAYDNTMAVNPLKPGNLLLGGTVIFTWHQGTPSDTVGTWTDLTYYGGWPHPDQQSMAYDPVDTSVIYNGNDGGIYKSFNGGHTWVPMNRNYNVTQFDAIAFAPYMSAIPAGFSVGEGVMGGTQDNGTPYINGYQTYYMDGVDLSGGDGGKSAISQIAPNIYFVTSDNASLFRGGNLNTLGTPSNFYTTDIGDTEGANIDSIVSLAASRQEVCFYHTIALYENSYQTTKNLNTMKWISDTMPHAAGDTVYPISPNGNTPFPYVLPFSIPKNDTLIIPNPVVSKLACGFSGNYGVWLTYQAADLTDVPIWMPIGGPLSKPDAFTTHSPIHTMAFSPDGDALFVGCEDGTLFRFTGLDNIVDKRFATGGLWSEQRGTGARLINDSCRVRSKHMGNFGQDILSISVDPKNGNHVMVTVGNYSATTYVYYCDSALSGIVDTAFRSVQGNLPHMPVYSCVLDVMNRSGNHPKSALVGTERGIYSTLDITVPNPTWGYETTGGPNTLILAMAQQTLPPWNCNNSYNVYVGSHGRGAWVSQTFLWSPNGVPVVADVTAAEGLKVYPNPMTYEGKVEFNLPTEGNVTVTVYDLTGRELKNIEAGNQSKGLHTLNINAEDLSTGTYIATVTGSNYHKSARFVVVK